MNRRSVLTWSQRDSQASARRSSPSKASLIDGATSDKTQKAAKAHEASQNDLLRSHTLELSEKDLAKEIKRLEKLMLQHAQNLEFEKAARVRDQLSLLRQQVFGGG